MVSRRIAETVPHIVDEGLATITQASEFLSWGTSSIYKAMDAGELTYAKLGKSRRIPWRALREFAARQLVDGSAK
jgi:excisionase family DNA binding protein